MTGTPFHAYYTARLLETLQDDDIVRICFNRQLL